MSLRSDWSGRSDQAGPRRDEDVALKDDPDIQTVEVYLPVRLARRLRLEAARTCSGRESKSEVVRDALDLYFSGRPDPDLVTTPATLSA